jgi:cytidylate kinase
MPDNNIAMPSESESMKEIPVIAIDGPSASGKGTVSRLLAQQLGWHMLDSGALYRLVAYAAQKHDIALDDVSTLAALAAHLDVSFVTEKGKDDTRVLLEGEDVTLAIRSEVAGNAASLVAAITEVREALLARQRAFRRAPGLVADGRDMGTVVFPDATMKVFLTASAEERAKRRYNQLKEKGIGASLSDLFDEIAERDRRDSERAAAPLKPAPDAIPLDTTDMTIDQVVAQIKSFLDDRQKKL